LRALRPETRRGGDRKSEAAKSSRQLDDLIGGEVGPAGAVDGDGLAGEKSSGQLGHLIQDRFTKDTAEKTGRSEATIQRAARRGEAIAPDVLREIQGLCSVRTGHCCCAAALAAAPGSCRTGKQEPQNPRPGGTGCAALGGLLRPTTRSCGTASPVLTTLRDACASQCKETPKRKQQVSGACAELRDAGLIAEAEIRDGKVHCKR